MDNKIYYHNVKTTSPATIAVISARCTLVIDEGDGNTIIQLTPSGYYRWGVKLKKVSVYSLEDYYYVVFTSSTAIYITVTEIADAGIPFKMRNGCMAAFDPTDATKLTELNTGIYAMRQQKTTTRVESGAEYAYPISAKSNAYAVEATLLLITARDENGVGGVAFVCAYRMNGASVGAYVISEIFATQNWSQFNIAGTTSGITLTHASAYDVSVTEITNL